MKAHMSTIEENRVFFRCVGEAEKAAKDLEQDALKEALTLLAVNEGLPEKYSMAFRMYRGPLSEAPQEAPANLAKALSWLLTDTGEDTFEGRLRIAQRRENDPK